MELLRTACAPNRVVWYTEQGGNVSKEELAHAARELDERGYRQEFQASFENLAQGRAYYAFERSGNVLECRTNPEFR
jgi:hypothetical protein